MASPRWFPQVEEGKEMEQAHLLAALLALSDEPLGGRSLATLLSGRVDPDEQLDLEITAFARRLEPVVVAVVAHHRPAFALRSKDDRALLLAGEMMKSSLEAAAALLSAMAAKWEAIRDPELRDHVLRRGNHYDLAWRGAEGARAVRARLLYFTYLQARTALYVPAIEELLLEYEQTLARMDEGARDEELGIWGGFWADHVHVLRRQDAEWPANRILFQLAMEHGPESVVSRAALEWLRSGRCDWCPLLARGSSAGARSNGLRSTIEHRCWVTDVIEIADRTIVSCSDDGAIRRSDPRTGRLVQVYEGHTAHVMGVREMRSGDLLSWAGDGTLRLWDVESGEALHTMSIPEDTILSAREIADGIVVSRTSRGTLTWWDASSGQSLQALRFASPSDRWDDPVPITAIDAERGIAWGLGSLAIVNLRTGAVERRWTASARSNVTGVLLLGAGLVLAWCDDGAIRGFRLAGEGPGGEEALFVLPVHDGTISAVYALSEARLFIACSDGTLHIWGLKERARRRVWEDEASSIESFVRAGNDRFLAITRDGRVRLWQTQGDGIDLRMDVAAGARGVTPLVSGEQLLWFFDGSLGILDTETCELRAHWRGHDEPLMGAVGLTSGAMASWSTDGTVRCWPATGGCLPARGARSTRLAGTRLLRDRRLLSWSDGARLDVWSLATGRPLASVEVRGGRVLDAVELPSGRIASSVQDGTLQVWDPGRQSSEQTISLDAAAHRLFVAGEDSLVSWSPEELTSYRLGPGDALDRIDRFRGRMHGVAFLGEQRIVTWAGSDIVVRGFATADAAVRVRAHEGGVTGIMGVPGGFCSYSVDGTIRVWSLDGASPRRILRGHEAAVLGVVLLDSGHRVASFSRDDTVRLWDIESGELLSTTRLANSRWIAGMAQIPGERVAFVLLTRLYAWGPGLEQPVSVAEGVGWPPWEGARLDALVEGGRIAIPRPEKRMVTLHDVGADVRHVATWHGTRRPKAVNLTDDGRIAVMSLDGALDILSLTMPSSPLA